MRTLRALKAEFTLWVLLRSRAFAACRCLLRPVSRGLLRFFLVFFDPFSTSEPWCLGDES